LVYIDRFMRGMPRWSLVLAAAVLTLVIGFLDYLSGEKISLSIFFLLPISITSLYIGKKAGISFCVIGAAISYMVDVSTRQGYIHSAVPVWDAIVQLGFFLLAAVTLSALEAAYVRERGLARSDPLTGVVNTKYFYDLAGREIERAERYGREFSVAYMDLDNFKEVNDSYGHEVGDEVLLTITRIIYANIRKSDIIARLGGDEFIVMFPETRSDDALAAMHKLRELIIHNMQQRNWPVTLSIGMVTYLEPPASVEEMITKADRLMYQVKNTTKDAITWEVCPA
jgi:diguanylate cyclase (GGDEF)-like protein